MIALNTGYFTACGRFWGWDRWVFGASDTISQDSAVSAWSNGRLNLTLLNLTLPFLIFIFFNEEE